MISLYLWFAICYLSGVSEALTKETFAVLCFDEGNGDGSDEVFELSDGGCKRLLSVCKGVTKEKLLSDHLDAPAVESIKACLERILCKASQVTQESIAGVTCDVGYLWLKHQRTLRQALSKFPVLTTSMMQLPFIWTCFGITKKTLLVTWNDGDAKSYWDLLETAGIRVDTDRVEILTLSTSDPKWSAFLSRKSTAEENQELLNQLVSMVHEKIIHILDQAWRFLRFSRLFCSGSFEGDGNRTCRLKGGCTVNSKGNLLNTGGGWIPVSFKLSLPSMSQSQAMGVNCIMLDSMLSKFSKDLRGATDLPIFDDISMMKLFSSASSLSHFSDANVLCRLQETMKYQTSSSPLTTDWILLHSFSVDCLNSLSRNYIFRLYINIL